MKLSTLYCIAIVVALACSNVADNDPPNKSGGSSTTSSVEETDTGTETESTDDDSDEPIDPTPDGWDVPPEETTDGPTEFPTCCRCLNDHTWECQPWTFGEELCNHKWDETGVFDPDCIEGWTDTHYDDFECMAACG
jgi:hypothetical protein